jgi:hypothetical protein
MNEGNWMILFIVDWILPPTELDDSQMPNGHGTYMAMGRHLKLDLNLVSPPVDDYMWTICMLHDLIIYVSYT